MADIEGSRCNAAVRGRNATSAALTRAVQRVRVCCAGPAQTRQQPKANAQGQRDVQQRERPAIRNQPAAQMQERNPTLPTRAGGATRYKSLLPW